MIRLDSKAETEAWQTVLTERLRQIGAADHLHAREAAAALSTYLAERRGGTPVPDAQLDTLLATALCAAGVCEPLPALLTGGRWTPAWRAVLGRDAPASLRALALYRCVRPVSGAICGERAWQLDLAPLLRTEPSGLELGRYRWLAAALDGLVAIEPRGFDALILRAGSPGRFGEEAAAFCRLRLEAAAARQGWRRAPAVIWATVHVGRRAGPRARRPQEQPR